MGRKAIEFDTEVLLDLAEAGETLVEQAKELGVSTPTLAKAIKKVQEEQGLILQYKAIQSLHLTKLQADLLDGITPEKIQAADLGTIVSAVVKLKSAEHLIDGKPTELKGNLFSYLVKIEKENIAATKDLSEKLINGIDEEKLKNITPEKLNDPNFIPDI